MKKISQAELDKILTDHIKYVVTAGSEGTGADLSGLDLSKLDLRDADLREVKLGGAVLSGMDLICSDLREAHLVGADLEGAYLTKADLRGANLRKANLQGAILHGASLRGASLRGASLVNAKLTDADLREADLREADIAGAHLDGADLNKANMLRVDLEYANGLSYPQLRLAITEYSVGADGRLRHKFENEPPTESDVRALEQDREETAQQAAQIRNKLEKATDAEERSRLQKEAADKDTKLEKQDVELKSLRSEIERLKEDLDQGIDDAMDSIEGSIEQTDEDIKSYRSTSACLSLFGMISYGLTFLIGIGIGIYFGLIEPMETEHWAPHWVAIATPLILFFSIGTALLRHDAKIRQRYEHLSDKKHQLEKASGVLLASKHLSQVENLNDDRHRVIVETFEAARDSLLNAKPAGSKTETDKAGGQEQAIINTVIRALAKKATS